MNSYFEKIKKAGLNPNIELVKLLLMDVALVGLFVFLYLTYKNTYIVLGGVLGVLFLSYLFVSRYDDILKKKDEQLTDQFVQCFTYFQIYIENGYNVYHALEEIITLCSPEIRALFKKLISEIDEDKTLKPYVNFSKNFKNLSVKEVMLSIYQMVDTGEGENYLRQFESLFGKFSQERHKLQKEGAILALQRLSILPLAGSGIVMLILSAALIQIMGDYYNVI